MQSQYSRCSNLLFSGIQATTAEVAAATIGHPNAALSESVTDKIIAFCHDNLFVGVTRSDICITHRLTSKRPTGEQAIIVRFVNRLTRDKVYHARTKLRTVNQGNHPKEMLFINEDLSPMNTTLRSVRDALKKKQLASVYSNNCKIYVNKMETAPAKVINFLDELRIFLC